MEFGGLIAAPYTKQQTPTAQRIDRRGILRRAQWVLEGQHHDGRADFHGLGPLRDRCCQQQRVAQHAVNLEMMLGQPDRIEAHLLADLYLPQNFIE